MSAIERSKMNRWAVFSLIVVAGHILCIEAWPGFSKAGQADNGQLPPQMTTETKSKSTTKLSEFEPESKPSSLSSGNPTAPKVDLSPPKSKSLGNPKRSPEELKAELSEVLKETGFRSEDGGLPETPSLPQYESPPLYHDVASYERPSHWLEGEPGLRTSLDRNDAMIQQVLQHPSVRMPHLDEPEPGQQSAQRPTELMLKHPLRTPESSPTVGEPVAGKMEGVIPHPLKSPPIGSHTAEEPVPGNVEGMMPYSLKTPRKLLPGEEPAPGYEFAISHHPLDIPPGTSPPVEEPPPGKEEGMKGHVFDDHSTPQQFNDPLAPRQAPFPEDSLSSQTAIGPAWPTDTQSEPPPTLPPYRPEDYSTGPSPGGASAPSSFHGGDEMANSLSSKEEEEDSLEEHREGAGYEEEEEEEHSVSAEQHQSQQAVSAGNRADEGTPPSTAGDLSSSDKQAIEQAADEYVQGVSNAGNEQQVQEDLRATTNPSEATSESQVLDEPLSEETG